MVGESQHSGLARTTQTAIITRTRERENGDMALLLAQIASHLRHWPPSNLISWGLEAYTPMSGSSESITLGFNPGQQALGQRYRVELAI